jgi:type IV secretory pathway VirB10-like protein
MTNKNSELGFKFNEEESGTNVGGESAGVQPKPNINVNSKGNKNGKGLINKKLEKTVLYSIIALILAGATYEIVEAIHNKNTVTKKVKVAKPKQHFNNRNSLPKALNVPTTALGATPTPLKHFHVSNSGNHHQEQQNATDTAQQNANNQQAAKQAQVDTSAIISLSGSGGKHSAANTSSLSGKELEISKIKKEIAQAKSKESPSRNQNSNGTGALNGLARDYGRNPNGNSNSENGNSPSGSSNSFNRGQAHKQLNGVIRIHSRPAGQALSIGTVIPATTIMRINTQQPGTVLAQVNRNIYSGDGVLVIPRGSKLIGTYNSKTFNGQDRVLLAFNRMMLPDGRYLNMKGVNSNGPRGASGTAGSVDSHFWTILGSSLLVALLAQGVSDIPGSQGNMASSGSGSTTNNYGNGMSNMQPGAQILSQSLSRILQPYSNIQSSITIPQGQRITVVTNKTIIFGN